MSAPSIPSPPAGPAPLPPPPPGWLRTAVLLLSVVLGVSTLMGGWVALVRADQTLWFTAVFEAIVLSAAVVGFLAGLGRFRQGWAMSLVCVGGTVLVCAVFAFLEVRANFQTDAVVGPWVKKALAFRLLMAAGFGGAASLAVWSRDARSGRSLVRAACVLAPVALVGLWLWWNGGSVLASSPSSASSASPGADALRVVLLCLGGLVGIILVAVGGHLVIRSYEWGRPTGEKPGGA